MKTAKNFRLSETAIKFLHAIAKEKCMSYTAVVEMLLRDKAKSEGIK